MGSESVRDRAKRENRELGYAVLSIAGVFFCFFFVFGLVVGLLLPW